MSPPWCQRYRGPQDAVDVELARLDKTPIHCLYSPSSGVPAFKFHGLAQTPCQCSKRTQDLLSVPLGGNKHTLRCFPFVSS
jgi:hypothetical protein